MKDVYLEFWCWLQVGPVLLSPPVWKAVGVSCRAADWCWPPHRWGPTAEVWERVAARVRGLHPSGPSLLVSCSSLSLSVFPWNRSLGGWNWFWRVGQSNRQCWKEMFSCRHVHLAKVHLLFQQFSRILVIRWPTWGGCLGKRVSVECPWHSGMGRLWWRAASL